MLALKSNIARIAMMGVMLFQINRFEATPVYGQPLSRSTRISELHLEGNQVFTSEQIRQILGWSEAINFDETRLSQQCQNLLHAYLASGRPFASIDSLIYRYSADSAKVQIRLFLSEGPTVRLDQLYWITPDSLMEANIRQKMVIRMGRRYSATEFQDDMETALSVLENSGYPFAMIALDSIQFQAQSEQSAALQLYLKMQPGPHVHIDEIRISGNTVTQNHVIIRELRLKPGQSFDQRRVDKIPARLTRLGFFRQIEKPDIILGENNRGILLIKVEEGNASKLDGLLGYNPGSGYAPGYFTGLIDLTLGNLLGTGRAIEAHWQKRDRKTQEFRFGYREPWILGYPLHAGLFFEQLIQDTSYIQRSWRFQQQLPLLENLTGFIGVGRTTVQPDSLGSLLWGIPASRTGTVSIGIDYDTRDDLVNPRSGLRYRTSYEYGRKKNHGSSDPGQILQLAPNTKNEKLHLDFEWNLPVMKYQVLSLAVYGRQSKSDEPLIPITDQFRFGGARTLRGYREEQFRGSRVTWSNFEYRYLLGKRSRAFLFFDSGYYWRKEAVGTIESAKIGYGFGLRIETGLGILGIDYGLGQGDGLMNGKVHVGLVNQF